MEAAIPSRYRIRRELGRGGMGVVFEAEDTRLRRIVAVKVLQPDPAGGDDRRARFKHEARAASALNHPNIVTVYDIDTSETGDNVIVMEYVDGESLSAVVARGAIPTARAIEFGLQIAHALGAAHAVGLVHRDIKPANVIVSRTGQIKVLDFGLAKSSSPIADDTDETRTAAPRTDTGIIVGTAAYMSPEQAIGGPVDARSDVFSLGSLLYELISGRRPFERESRLSTVRAILEYTPPALDSVGGDIPADLGQIIARCLAKDPAARYADAAALADDLSRLSRRDESLPRRRLRSRRFVAAVAIGLLAISIAPLYQMWQRQSRATTLITINRHVDAGRLAVALRMARDLEARFPNDPEIARTIEAFTLRRDIDTTPSGALIEMRDFLSDTGEWVLLGTSPIRNARLPFAAMHWRVTKPGFEPIEARFIWDFRHAGITLVPAASAAPGTVGVPDGNANIVGDRTQFVPAFRIDKYEVTNRAYKDFVDAGGYREPKHWRVPILKDGKELPFADAMALFTDRTGRPGPSTWEAGTYSERHADDPVTGVSWYEAVAYATYRGTQLPTVAHFYRAMGPSNLREDAMRGVFQSADVRSVTTLVDLGAYGTYGLAGNVREWCWNADDHARYILGGAWNDPPYMATRPEAKHPLDRSETNGLRTIRTDKPIPDPLLADIQVLPDTAPFPKPVADDVFEAYRGFYAYDKAPLDARVERVSETDLWHRERVSIAHPNGSERLPIDLLLPKGSRPPYQVVIWYPGSYSLDLPSSEEIVAPFYFDFIVRSGRAVALPVFAGFYERRGPTRRPEGAARRDAIVQRSKELGWTIDYFETRRDLDAMKVAFYVFSAATATIALIAMEPRLKTAVLLSGGLNRERLVAEMDPVNFAPRVRAPVLLMAGRYDVLTSVDTAQKPLFDLFGTPGPHKRHYIFDGGHVPPRGLLMRELLDWLDRYLGPVGRPAGSR